MARQLAEQDWPQTLHSVDGHRNDHRPPRLNGLVAFGRVILKVAELAPWPNVAVKAVGPAFCFLAESSRRNRAQGPENGKLARVAVLANRVTCACGRPLTFHIS